MGLVNLEFGSGEKHGTMVGMFVLYINHGISLVNT